MAPSSQSKPVSFGGILVRALVIILLAGAFLVRLVDTQESPVAAGAGTAADEGRASEAVGGSPRQGLAAPGFTLLGPDGQPISLSEWRGRPILINFWASWCGPCEVEMPAIQAAYQAHQEDGLVVLAVAVDDNVKNVQRFFDEHDLTILPLMDDGNVSRAYQVFGLPTSYFVGPDGKIAAVHTGPLTEGKINQYLSTLN